MKTTMTLLASLALAVPAFAKDKEIPLAEAPEGVKARVQKIVDGGSKVDKVELEDKTKNYGIKVTDKNGVRWEIIVDATGNVLKTEQKKAKK
jgi:uncharacterized membrane protein YkoI